MKVEVRFLDLDFIFIFIFYLLKGHHVVLVNKLKLEILKLCLMLER